VNVPSGIGLVADIISLATFVHLSLRWLFKKISFADIALR
jgi:hypothetical protein